MKLTRNHFPQIYWNRKWKYICPFQFTENNHGAELFCNKLGLHSGFTRRVTKEEEGKYLPRQYDPYDTFLLGSCKESDTWLNCTTSCNIENLGRGCSYKIHQITKKHYYVCRKQQTWLYFLYCFGNDELPISSISSCYGKSNFIFNIPTKLYSKF